MMRNSSMGYTLIELLISITLGLLLVAAATQLFLGGVVSVRLQQAGADVQDNGLLGTDLLTRHLRLVNLSNNTTGPMIDTTTGGGVVLTAASVSPTSPITNCYLTNGNPDSTSGCTAADAWTGVSNVTEPTSTPSAAPAAVKSSQLTIQFQAPSAMTDCEGTQVAAGDRVIQRYFLREDLLPGSPPSDPALKNLVLACDAGRIIGGVLSDFGGVSSTTLENGQVLMNRVDHFRVTLGTEIQSGADAGKLAYLTPKQYRDLSVPSGGVKPKILSIQIALLVRSMDNTGNGVLSATPPTYDMLDRPVKPRFSTTSNYRYVREVYATTIYLRNAAGEPL
jgi:type IV pilus assembly protein PilW